MRETWSTLQTAAQNYVANDTSSATLTFLQNEINRAKTFVYADLGDFVTQRVQTAVTVASQQYYHLPVDCGDVESVTVTIGGVIYTLTSIDSQQAWDGLNAVTFTGTAIPRYFIERKRDFGIWPIPQESADTITLTYQIVDKNMQYADSTTNTVSVTNNSQTVVGSGTAWDNTFVGRWFQTTNDGFWYKIVSVTDTTHLSLETSFEGTTASTQNYTIGDSPDLPEELHQFLPMRAAAMYYAGFRKDFNTARNLTNMFYTGDPNVSSKEVLEGVIEAPGGYLAIKANYATRSTDMVIHRNRNTDPLLNDLIWATTVTI